ncbi:MAG TPA: hypothetical protein VH854_11100 [Thermoanaerobaculia bacterium]|jgi:uncharacterized protein YdeI (BOF family)|nr:hypothetical protein [Thermoanaerobaculia bacterium]
MKRWVWLALAAGTAYGATALAQSQDPNVRPEDQLKARRAQSEAAQSATAAQPGEMQTLSGTVKSYKAGKKIVVTDASGKSHSLKLDDSARVDANLNPGDSVTVMWMTDGAGKERVTSVSTSGATGTSVSGATGGTSSTTSSGTTASPYSGTTAADSGSAASPATSTSSSSMGVNGQMSSSTPPSSTTPGAYTTGTPGASRMRMTPRTTRTPGGSDTGMQPQPTPIPK